MGGREPHTQLAWRFGAGKICIYHGSYTRLWIWVCGMAEPEGGVVACSSGEGLSWSMAMGKAIEHARRKHGVIL